MNNTDYAKWILIGISLWVIYSLIMKSIGGYDRVKVRSSEMVLEKCAIGETDSYMVYRKIFGGKGNGTN